MPSAARRSGLGDRSGGVALVTAAAVGVLAVLGGGAVEMVSLYAARAKMQDAADAAALKGAAELMISPPQGVTARTEALVTQELASVSRDSALAVHATVTALEDGTKALVVRIDSRRPSYFGNLLPPGGFPVSVTATATSLGLTPLCILGHGERLDKVINAQDSALIEAPGCLVHSNEDIEVAGSARMVGERIESVAETTGSVTPRAYTGAKPIPDPFVDRNLTPPKCPLIQLPTLLQSVGLLKLPKGVHCQDIVVFKNATMRLEAGEHWFVHSTFTVKEDARLEGDDVAMIFDRDSKFQFQDRALVKLNGRRSGVHAGFLIIGRRDNTNDFELSSDHVESLLGTIYMPKARLVVSGSKDVARKSDWTVIVAERLLLKGAPTLVINTNYGGSPVPVPAGVGPAAGSRLVR
ncbi:MAG TPA: pilus assembly protein TadG-related protein [Caulobacteraceae bacterium]